MAHFLCTSDWHIRATTPHYRTDDYSSVQLSKIKWILDLAKKENCSAILHGGDFFDHPDQSNKTKIDLLKLIYQRSEVPICTVYGQHDKKYRNIQNTALALFEEVEAVQILSKTPVVIDDVHIYGASWDEEVPIIEDTDAINILAIHKMIVKDKPLWHRQEGYSKAKTFLSKNQGYTLINSGDNHQSFSHQTNDNRWLINCGSMMRMSTDQQSHKPCVVIYDTETKEAIRHFIPIEKDVFSPEAAEVKERNRELEAFIQSLAKDNKERQLSFEENVEMLKATTKFSEEVRTLVATFLESYYGSR
jgi:DNA repair protein SbcD/Mre11